MISILISRFIAMLGGKKKPSVSQAKASTNHVIVCVGHSRIGDSGAVSVGGVNEWVYNKDVAEKLCRVLRARGVSCEVISHYPSRSYSGAMSWLRKEIQKRKGTLAIELHFNAAHEEANGFEYLHVISSARGLLLAQCLLKAHMSVIGNKQKCRGTTAIKAGDRGYGFLSKVAPPAVICEPFFGTNPKEWERYKDQGRELALCYADGICTYLRCIAPTEGTPVEIKTPAILPDAV